MQQIRHINKLSLAKIIALFYGFIGFFATLFITVFVIHNLIARRNPEGSAVLIILFNAGTGLFAGILSAMFTASIGWIVGYAAAAIYNWFSKRHGGVKIELSDPENENQTKTD